MTPHALGLAKGAALGQRQALIERYGENLDANSHGESFLTLFQSRFVAGGLYLLDEPEAPLAAAAACPDVDVERDGRSRGSIHHRHGLDFDGVPRRAILSFDEHPVIEAHYDDVEHVSLTRAF